MGKTIILTGSIAAQKKERNHSLDAIRAIALIIGIFFHGMQSFVTWMPDMVWAVKEPHGSVWLDLFFYVSHIFRMPVFFLMSGFFSHMLLNRLGTKAFLKHRLTRLGLPFLLFWPFMFVLAQVLWIWGFREMGYFEELPEINALTYGELLTGHFLSFSWLENGLSLTHLWFLYLLLWFIVLILPIRFIFVRWLDRYGKFRRNTDRFFNFLMKRWYASLVIGAMAIPPMLWMKTGFGIETPDHGLIPHWGSFAVYALYFCLGWLLHRQPHLMTAFKKSWLTNLLIAAILVTIVSLMFCAQVYGWEVLGSGEGTLELIMMAVYNGLYALAAMSCVFAFTGLMMVLFSYQNKYIRYLADASYWMYIAHLPLIVFFQVLLVPYTWHWTVKLGCIYTVGFTVLLLSYHFMVRNTWIGVLLNGRKINKI